MSIDRLNDKFNKNNTKIHRNKKKLANKKSKNPNETNFQKKSKLKSWKPNAPMDKQKLK